MAARPMDKSEAAGAANDNNLAELVWRHFAEEITEALHEAQQALAPGKAHRSSAKSRKR